MERNIDILNLTPEKLAELQQQERNRIAAEEAAKKAKDEEARKKAEAENARRHAVLAKPAEVIVAALKRRAPNRQFKARYTEYGRAYIDEVRKDNQYSRLPHLCLEMELSGSTWHRHENGRVRIAVGEYGNKTSFPQRKDGTHNYERIAELAVDSMLAREKQDKAQNEAAAARKYNEQGVVDLRKTLRARRYDSTFSLSPASSVEKPVFVEVKISRSMTFSETEKLFKALLALGLVQQEKEGEE